MDTLALLGAALGLGFTAGIRLYSTVFAIGLGIRLGLIQLRPELEALSVLSHWAVIGTAGTIFVIEFLADKVPWVDSLWDAMHTFVRPVGAAFLAATAVGELDGAAEIVCILLCGAVAFSSHSSKAGLRLLVNHSPEPFSNVALSTVEEGVVLAGVWMSLAHPMATLVIVSLFFGAFLWICPKIFRLIRSNVAAIRGFFRRLTGADRPASSDATPTPGGAV